jgi:histidinol-phosphate/aromatic aminotransferase/cobyric acid decarboxylase-like protein
VLVRELSEFGAPTALRISVGTDDELEALDVALAAALRRAA